MAAIAKKIKKKVHHVPPSPQKPPLIRRPSGLACIANSDLWIQVVAQMSKSLESTIAEDEVHAKLCQQKPGVIGDQVL